MSHIDVLAFGKTLPQPGHPVKAGGLRHWRRSRGARAARIGREALQCVAGALVGRDEAGAGGCAFGRFVGFDLGAFDADVAAVAGAGGVGLVRLFGDEARDIAPELVERVVVKA